MAHPGGRPPLYNNCIDFDAMCERYFEEESTMMVDGSEIQRPFLVSGLSLYLGMDSDTLLQYGKKDGFIGIVKRAKEKISLGLQERSIIKPQQAAGCLFNLKCNHGMKETDRLELTGKNGGPIETNSKVQVYIPDNGRD